MAKRYLIKLSGEALSGEKGFGFDEETTLGVARQIKEVSEDGNEISIVIGGGNFWRGRSAHMNDRTRADQIGMLATVMNCIYVSEIFRSVGLKTRIFTPFLCGSFTELYSKDVAVSALSKGEIVFFAGGTGHPYFSTDTATVLRAVEIEADEILLAKAVDGIYTSDPKTDSSAKRYDTISIDEVIALNLTATDLASSILAKENKMPMFVFSLNEENSIVRAARGTIDGTCVTV